MDEDRDRWSEHGVVQSELVLFQRFLQPSAEVSLEEPLDQLSLGQLQTVLCALNNQHLYFPLNINLVTIGIVIVSSQSSLFYRYTLIISSVIRLRTLIQFGIKLCIFKSKGYASAVQENFKNKNELKKTKIVFFVYY